MGLFDWLFGRQEEPEALRFVQALARKEEPTKIEGEWESSFEYTFTLTFETIEIEMEYDYIQEDWRVYIWSDEADTYLYYSTADCALPYLQMRYKLLETLSPILQKKQEEDNLEETIASNVKQRYLKGGP